LDDLERRGLTGHRRNTAVGDRDAWVRSGAARGYEDRYGDDGKPKPISQARLQSSQRPDGAAYPASGFRSACAGTRTAVGGFRGAGAGTRPKRLLQVVAQLLRAGWMAQLAERLGLDLADALTRDAEPLADLFQRALVAVDQPESQLQYAPL